ncbi:MAG: hypothetical protein QM704_00095 [Anaeromyxobacteraceae bacterium]
MAHRDPPRILLVEPSSPVRERLVGALLDGRDADVIIAVAHASEGLRALEQAPFLAAVIDAECEGNAGVTLAATILHRWPATAVLLLAGDLEDELLLRARRLGVHRVLQRDDTAGLTQLLGAMARPVA